MCWIGRGGKGVVCADPQITAQDELISAKVITLFSKPHSDVLNRYMPISIPSPSFLDTCEFLGAFDGEKRWRSPDRKRLYTWDSLHGEIEVFNARGRHLMVIEAVTGEFLKSGRKGRRINV
jgi:hypothetical protein